MKNPAAEVNRFLNDLGKYLKKNQPGFVERYNVTVTNMPHGEDMNVIQFKLNFYTKNSVIQALHQARMVESEHE